MRVAATFAFHLSHSPDYNQREETMLRLPVIHGVIKRRLLVNFRVAPDVIQAQLPAPFRPKLHHGHAIAGICLIRLEGIRPLGFPAAMGITSENAAHRIAVAWNDADGIEREGVFIPRRDTSSRINSFAGGRLFPGEQHHARFQVADDGHRVDLTMESGDRTVSVHVTGAKADALPAASCFSAVQESSAFFEGGCLGFSVTRDPTRLDSLTLHTCEWHVYPLAISEVRTSYFDDTARFPAGTVEFDHALIMRDIPHEWRQADDLRCAPAAVTAAK